jgi:hypothetical protein
MAATKYCHTSQRLGRCQRTKEWKDWKCHELKAKYYSYLKGHDECFTKFKDANDFIADYNYYCNKGWILKFWSLAGAIVVLALCS